MKKYCKETVSHPQMFMEVRCSFPAKKGSDYCGVHSPEAKAKRKAKADARYAEWSESMDAKARATKRTRLTMEKIMAWLGDDYTIDDLDAAIAKGK